MPNLATFTDIRASDVIVYEEPLARFSREAVKVKPSVKIGDLLKESAAAGIYEAAATPADLATVKYISFANASDCFDAGMAVLARHAIVREERLNWPDGTTDANKKTLAAMLETKSMLLIRKQGF